MKSVIENGELPAGTDLAAVGQVQLPESQKAGANDLDGALHRLMTLHEGYAGVSDVVACGSKAVPELRRILGQTESSGIFEPRLRAISALMALGAAEAVILFLETPRTIADPTARVGEEAVISAAARALKNVRTDRVFRLLLKLARRQPLIGVIEALGAIPSPDAIPGLMYGLYEDETRKFAVAALHQQGRAARPALIRAALGAAPKDESPSELRSRRAATGLLALIRLSAWQQTEIKPLMWDADTEIAAYACRACMIGAPDKEAAEISLRLSSLIPQLRPPVRAVALEWIKAKEPPEATEARPQQEPETVRAENPGPKVPVSSSRGRLRLNIASAGEAEV